MSYESIPQEAREIAEAAGWGKPNWYIPAASDFPVLTPWIVEFLSDNEEDL